MPSRSDVVCGHGGNPGQIMFRPRSTPCSRNAASSFVAAHIDYKQGTDGEMGKEGRMTRGEGDTCTNAEMIAILELLLALCNTCVMNFTVRVVYLSLGQTKSEFHEMFFDS